MSRRDGVPPNGPEVPSRVLDSEDPSQAVLDDAMRRASVDPLDEAVLRVLDAERELRLARAAEKQARAARARAARLR